MNISRIKIYLWIGSLAIGGYLAWFVADFFKRKADLERSIDSETQLAVLEDVERPEAPRDEVVGYENVKGVFHDMSWTLEEPPPPPPPPSETPVQQVVTPVSELLLVLMVQVDTDTPEGSLVYVRFLDNKLVAAAKTQEDAVLRIGTHLAAPYDSVVVAAIEEFGVRFRFEGEGEDAREPEFVATIDFPDSVEIVKVGPDGAIEAAPRSGGPRIRRNDNFVPFRPKRTVQVSKNEFLLGYETIDSVDQDYSRILSRDIGYSRHKDPRTGQVDGIEITRVSADSIPAQHGLSKGEVLKSINGHPVRSVNDAIAYVKSQADSTDTWIALFEKQGREYTRTYKSPPPE